MEYILITTIALIVLADIVIFLYLQNNIIDITQYNIKSNDCGSLKIVQLSDLHSKPFNKVLKKTQEINPDIICITGDYINDKCKNKDKMLNFGKELVKIAKVKDYKARKNGTFVYKDMSPYFAELENNSGFKIVLSHFPENFENVKEMNYSQYDFDIQLSGHAHGGQFCLPFIGPVFSPGQGLFPKYAKGSFGDRPKLIVSRGLGNAEFPFRLFNHPEINVININQ